MNEFIITILILEAGASIYLATRIFKLQKDLKKIEDNKDNLIIHISSVLDGHSRATDRQTKATKDLIEIMKDVKEIIHGK